MASPSRQDIILQWVREKHAATIEGLSEHFQVTTQTIRRDINTLCNLGLLRRVHGGVQLPSDSANITVSARAAMHATAKQIIGRHVAQHITPESSVFLGIGTTVNYVAQALLNHNGLTVITNNFDAVRTLSANPDISIMVSGGTLRPSDGDLVGPETVAFINNFTVDFGIIGCGGLSSDGLLDFQPEEVAVSRAILNNSRRRILVAEASKWQRNALIKVTPFHHIDDFFTDVLPLDISNLEAIAPNMTIWQESTT